MFFFNFYLGLSLPIEERWNTSGTFLRVNSGRIANSMPQILLANNRQPPPPPYMNNWKYEIFYSMPTNLLAETC